MEERILDEDENRGIRIKRTKDGETDALEGTEGEIGEEEVAFEFPEEYDESLAGMSQAQVEDELARREKARQEALENCRKLIDEGNALLAEENFSEAEEKFAQASVFDVDSDEAADGLFRAATKNFTDTERLYTDARAEDLERLESGKKLVAEKLGGKLREEQRAYREEADSLRPIVLENRAKRREAFAANRKHYIIWTCVFIFFAAAFAIATAIAADNILRVKDSTVPLALTIVFGVITFLAVAALAVFFAKLAGANKLCRMNERPDATQDGERLLYLERRLEILDIIFGSDDPSDA